MYILFIVLSPPPNAKFVVGILLLVFKTQRQPEACGHSTGANVIQEKERALGNEA